MSDVATIKINTAADLLKSYARLLADHQYGDSAKIADDIRDVAVAIKNNHDQLSRHSAELQAAYDDVCERASKYHNRAKDAEKHNAELRRALTNLVALYAEPGESNLDRFERVAELFHRETGMLAPGKDQAAASGNSPTYEQRVEQWEAWYAKRAAAARAALSAGRSGGGE